MLNFKTKKEALQAISFGEVAVGETGIVEGRPAIVISLNGIETLKFLGETHTVGTQRPADGRTIQANGIKGNSTRLLHIAEE